MIPGQLVLWVSGVFNAWILLPLLVSSLLLAHAREVLRLRSAGEPGLDTLTPRTAQTHLLFSALLVVGVVLARV